MFIFRMYKLTYHNPLLESCENLRKSVIKGHQAKYLDKLLNFEFQTLL